MPHRPKIIVTRTQPGASQLGLRILDALNLPVNLAPVLNATATHRPAPDAIFEAEGIILTSPNGLRFATMPAKVDKTIPLYAVGATTAQFAKDDGWQNVITGPGEINGLGALLHERYKGGTLVHIRGVHVSQFTQNALAGLNVKGWETYETRADEHSLASIPKFLNSAGRHIVLVQSARAADLLAPHVQGVMDKVQGGNIAILCMSEAVLQSISPERARGFYCCKTPDENSLIGLVRDISQTMTDKD